MNYEIYLEVTSGAGIVPEVICMFILAFYLCREARRRHFHFLNWFALPPQMSLVIAMFIFNAGVLINASVVWVWRRFFRAEDFTIAQLYFLGIGRTLILVGALCTIRALTKPNLNNKVWYLTCALTVLAMLLMICVR